MRSGWKNSQEWGSQPNSCEGGDEQAAVIGSRLARGGQGQGGGFSVSRGWGEELNGLRLPEYLDGQDHIWMETSYALGGYW